MKKFEKVFEEKDGKIVEKLDEGRRVYKTKKALLQGEIFLNENDKYEKVVSVIADNFGGLTALTLEVK